MYADLYINNANSSTLAPFSSLKIDLRLSNFVVKNYLLRVHGVKLNQTDVRDKNPLTPVLLTLNDATYSRVWLIRATSGQLNWPCTSNGLD